jgi:hypothetical protein
MIGGKVSRRISKRPATEFIDSRTYKNVRTGISGGLYFANDILSLPEKERPNFVACVDLGVLVNWQNECVCPLFEKNRASQVAFGKRLQLSKNLLKLKRLKLKRL